MNSNGAEITHRFIIACHLKRSVSRQFSSIWARRDIFVSKQGYLVDWDAQKAVWDGVLSPEVFEVGFLLHPDGVEHS
jgi:hypothetical protein